MKHLFAALSLILLSSTMVNAQSIEFINYKSKDSKRFDKSSTNDLEKEGAMFSQEDDNPLEWNYGTIENGSTGYRFFKFKNTGDAPLVISTAKGSCGCTVPTWPREPIMPGATEFIKVKYDTKRTGSFTKYVTLTTNATENTQTRLKIFGTVNAPASVEPVPAK